LFGNRTKRRTWTYKVDKNKDFFCTFDVGFLKISGTGCRKKYDRKDIVAFIIDQSEHREKTRQIQLYFSAKQCCDYKHATCFGYMAVIWPF
jgi:hypothetical protein